MTPELVALFKTNWHKLVITAHDCRISYPFYYLKSEPFWKLIPKPGFDTFIESGSLFKSFASLNAAVSHAEIDKELYLLMKDQKTNLMLEVLLLDEYFTNTRTQFSNSKVEQQKLFEEIEKKILHEDAVAYRSEIKQLLKQKNEEEIYLRGSIFKREVPKIYNNTCSISGMHIDANINISMVDACHIVPFSESYNDTITNGIALCPNLHRAFDRGLISIDEDYKVLVSPYFIENETSFSIRAFEAKPISLPTQRIYFPLQDNLKWHRTKVFKN